jgi:N-acetylmuramoyl-L-alanine amidase
MKKGVFFPIYIYIIGVMVPSIAMGGSTQQKLWLETIVIDPGHGGKDPGAISSTSHIKEKVVNWNIARDLEKLLHKALPSVKILKTRNSDTFVSLGKRVEIANRYLKGRSLFVSIHTNSHNSEKVVEGVEVFYHYASNTTIANYRLKEFYSQIKAPKSFLKVPLIQIVNSKMKQESKRFAEIVAKGLKLASNEPIRRVIPSNLYVVSYSVVPAILVEVGFINSEKWLNRKYQEKVAKGIFLGILKYIKEVKER